MCDFVNSCSCCRYACDARAWAQPLPAPPPVQIAHVALLFSLLLFVAFCIEPLLYTLVSILSIHLYKGLCLSVGVSGTNNIIITIENRNNNKH